MSDDERLDFGPGGYLPDRAARQARKIILRAPLGLEWLVAAVVFGLVLLIAGGIFLVGRDDGAPTAPFVAVVDVDLLPRTGLRATTFDALILRDGVVRAYADARQEGAAWCEQSRQMEAEDGRVWSITGRGLGTPSLDTFPVVIHDGTIYVDPTRRVPGPSPDKEPGTPACAR